MAVSSRPPAWSLHAILPFPRARYEEDFAPEKSSGGVDRRADFRAALAQAASIVELPDETDAVLGYERAGEAMLKESDLLVAVWDGLPGSGRGGTQAVLSEARAMGIPVIWIHADDRDRAPVVLSSESRTVKNAKAHFLASDVVRRVVALAGPEAARRSPSPKGSEDS